MCIKPINGRPQKIGRTYCDINCETGEETLKVTVGYCSCGKKVGLNRHQLEELSKELPHPFWFFIERLIHSHLVIPK